MNALFVIALAVAAFCAEACPMSSSWQRTRILMKKPAETNFYMFFRGGVGGSQIPIQHVTTSAPTCCSEAYLAWQVNDCAFDWGGAQAGQGYYTYGEAKGTPSYWTTNVVGHPQYVSNNLYGSDYWMADFYMDCSQTYADGWFGVQGIWNNFGGPTWEVTAESTPISQGSCVVGPTVPTSVQANLGGQHWAKCGYDNHFQWESSWCSIVSASSTMPPTAPPTAPPTPSFQCGDYANPILSASRIVGGTDANPNGWPWQVSLQYNGHFCGGSLIRVSETQEMSDIVVTAAHCLKFGFPMNVVAGEHSLSINSGNEQSSLSSFGVQHPLYSNSVIGPYDIAIIRLDTPISFTSTHTIAPVCVPKDSPPVGTNCYTTGWGSLNYISPYGTSPDILQELVVPITSCAASFTVICAGFDNMQQGTCSGDSGGPLVWDRDGNNQFYLAGVTSYVYLPDGISCGYAPGGWARVSFFCSWIYQNVCNYSSVSGSGSSASCPLIAQLCQ